MVSHFRFPADDHPGGLVPCTSQIKNIQDDLTVMVLELHEARDAAQS